MLSIPLPVSYSLSQLLLSLSLCLRLTFSLSFLSPPPPSLYLFHCPLSLFTLQNPSLSIFILCLPPPYLSLSTSAAAVEGSSEVTARFAHQKGGHVARNLDDITTLYGLPLLRFCSLHSCSCLAVLNQT